MGIISANNMIRAISLFHLTFAFLLFRNPSLISNQGVVLLLGESMQLPTPRDFSKPTALSAFLAILFAFLGITDLGALSLSPEVSDEYWGLQAPLRLLFLFVLTAYTYLFKEGGMLGPRTADWRMAKTANVHNSIVFTWGFFEVAAWFWVYTTLREERVEKVNRAVDKQKKEAEHML